MKTLHRIKKKFKKSDFNNLEEFKAYPSIAWKTHVRKKNGKIIIEAGLLNCNSLTNSFRLFRFIESNSTYKVEEIVNYSCSLNTKQVTTATTMQRTLKENSFYLVVRHSDFGKEYYLLSTSDNDFQVQKGIYGSEKWGYNIWINNRSYSIDKKYII